MIRDPELVARLAKELDAENWPFRSFLMCYCRISGARLNTMAARIGDAAAAQMKCLDCGACCRDIVIPLDDEDIGAMAPAAGLSTAEFRERYVRAMEGYEQAIDGHPCPFQQGRRCMIYEARPKVCRGYPYIGGDIRSRMLGILERAQTCPIVFEMVEQLKTRLGFRQLYPRGPSPAAQTGAGPPAPHGSDGAADGQLPPSARHSTRNDESAAPT